VNTDSAITNPESPILSERRAAWEGIRIEHYRIKGGELPEHRHRQHIVVMPLGAGCNGELRTSNGLRVRGGPGSSGVCVIPAGLPHQAQLEGLSEYATIYLEPSVVAAAAEAAGVSRNVEVIEKYDEADSVVRSVGMALLAELESNGLSSHLYAESLANVLAIQLLRNYTASPIQWSPRTGGLSGRKLLEVKRFIEENYTQELSLEQLAQVAGISRFHFAREFKKMTGASPHQYLLKLRIQHAKALLQNSEVPLIEVGLQSGFSHQSHFTRLFRRFTGTTPQSYRLGVQQ
jgi:AraC family transcriptional regulator